MLILLISLSHTVFLSLSILFSIITIAVMFYLFYKNDSFTLNILYFIFLFVLHIYHILSFSLSSSLQFKFLVEKEFKIVKEKKKKRGKIEMQLIFRLSFIIGYCSYISLLFLLYSSFPIYNIHQLILFRSFFVCYFSFH